MRSYALDVFSYAAKQGRFDHRTMPLAVPGLNADGKALVFCPAAPTVRLFTFTILIAHGRRFYRTGPPRSLFCFIAVR